MSKTWGIDVEGRRMLYEPWSLTVDGAYRAPDLEEHRNRYAVSGSAVRETLLYFEECGGDTARLVDLLNSHAIDARYRTNRETLLDASRWYTNEYYFYFILFTKKVIGRYDFRYGEDDPEGESKPLSEHHKIYELGLMRKIPWGVDVDGREIRDVTMANLIVFTDSFSSDQNLFGDFICFLNDCLTEGYALDTEILEKQMLWCSLQFVEYGFEFAKVCMHPTERIVESVFRSSLDKIRLPHLFRAVPRVILFSYFRNIFDSTNTVHETTYDIIEEKQLTIDGRIRNTPGVLAQYDRYILSCQKNDVLVWLGGVASLVALCNDTPAFPNYELRLNEDGNGFRIKYELLLHEGRLKEFLLATCLAGFLAVPSVAISLGFGELVSSAIIVVFAGIISMLMIHDRRLNRETRRVLENAKDQSRVSVSQIEELAATTTELMKERALLETKVQERTAALEEANRKLKELDEAKTRFFANISHELRTPIALIRAPLDSIIGGQHGASIDRGNRLFSIMRRNTLRLSRLVDDLLSVVRIESGGMRMEPVVLDAVGTVRNYLSEFESAAKLKEIELSFRTSGLERIPVSADPRGFETIFLNLMSNALKYTGGGGKIYVELAADSGTGMLVLTVTDTGIGIPESKRDLVFERFKRIYDEERNEYEGCGIGLSLSREIARLHGGDIAFTSREGAGSTFTATLPLAEGERRREAKGAAASALFKDRLVAEAYEADDQKAQRIGKASASDRSLPRLLLVEDNRDLVEFLSASLGDAYETVRAYDGEEAMAFLERGPLPDLVVSDIMMPKLDGVEFFRRTREVERLASIPFIFLTARATEEERLERLGMGAVDYLYKPFSMEELRMKLKAVLSIRETEKRGLEQRVLRALRGCEGTAATPTTEEVLDRFDLSAREREVALLLLKGMSDKEIAFSLGLSTKTVSHHISSVYRKTGTDGRMGFVRLVSCS